MNANIVPFFEWRKKFLIADMDNTIIKYEALDGLTTRAHVDNEIFVITKNSRQTKLALTGHY